MSIQNYRQKICKLTAICLIFSTITACGGGGGGGSNNTSNTPGVGAVDNPSAIVAANPAPNPATPGNGTLGSGTTGGGTTGGGTTGGGTTGGGTTGGGTTGGGTTGGGTTGGGTTGGGTTGGGSTGGSGNVTPVTPPCVEHPVSTTLRITTASCPAGTQGSAYAGCTISSTGGTPPYSYCVSQSASNPPLPEGMTINAKTGAINASKINGQGHYGAKLIVIDSNLNTASKVINFSVSGNNAYLANIFPANSIFHHRVDQASTNLPVDRSPAAAISSKDLNAKVNAAFGNQFSAPWPYGTPTIQVPHDQPFVPVKTTLYNYNFSSGPIPADAPIQGTAHSAGDRHVIVYHASQGSTPAALYEMWLSTYDSKAKLWSNGSNMLWSDVTSNALPKHGVGTTVAAGLPDGPLLITADEVIGTGTPQTPNGSIRHTIRFTVSKMLDNWVWPATGTAGTGSCTGVPTRTMLSQSAPPSACSATSPAGQMYRLKASIATPDCAKNSPQAAIIMTALRNYGMIVGDNSFPAQLTGTPDARWNDTDLQCLTSLTLADFEPVNVSSLMVNANSAQTSH
ncbi:hypothetical protein AAKU58_000614 [Oxalobacteraceae bacterium GrIS 1.18]